jgi:hypothetical protein
MTTKEKIYTILIYDEFGMAVLEIVYLLLMFWT